MTEPATAPRTDPNRHRRAIICVHPQLIHRLLALPPDVEVRHFGASHDSLGINVIVTSPDLPEVDPACVSTDIYPAYELIDGRAVLVDTGISAVAGARRWEWSYRYPDTGPIEQPNLTEADVRRKAAHDLSVIILRREPGATEWEEAPA